MIEIRNLRKRYGGAEVLRGVNFTARPGEITLLVGPNGAGKSTILKALAGLLRNGGGGASIDGAEIPAERAFASRKLSYLPQTPDFHPRLSCAALARCYARLGGASPDRVDAALQRVGLRDRAGQQAGTLSGGMKQRLGLALLLLPETPVLLLDEPGISLDPGWRRRLQEILREEADRGRTVLVTTHLVAEWRGKVDRCLLCEEGRVTRELDPATLSQGFENTLPPGSSGDGTAQNIAVANVAGASGHGIDAKGGGEHSAEARLAEAETWKEGKPPGTMAAIRGERSSASEAKPEASSPGAAARRPRRTLGTLFRREIQTAGISRQVWAFAFFALAAGLFAAFSGDGGGGEGSPFFLLQIALHAVTLFAVLAGVGTARAEAEEWPMLLARPGYRGAAATAKFFATFLALAVTLPLLFLPVGFTGASGAVLAGLFFRTVGIVAVFVAAGLATGYLLRDRVQALLGGVIVWLAAVFAYDFVALAAARWTPLREAPGIWVSLLMLNPVDSIRIQTLFSLEQIPAEAAGDHPVARWWIAHANAWFPVTVLFWTSAFLALARRRLLRMEI